ncbi:MAG TPA: DUF4412 domain-containing protein [Terriglobales bacterium]|nr:DUF4412 domain-containing protein [Terriglobales bacterium]
MISSAKWLALGLVLLFTVPASAGLTYRAHMDKFGKESSFQVWATDDKAKFVIESSDDPSMPPGFTIIAADSGEQLMLIVDQKEAYFQFIREEYRKLLKGKAAQKQLRIENSKLEELAVDEDGGTIAGYPTRHYKIKISFTDHEGDQTSNFVAIEEFWTAPSIPNPASYLNMLTQQTSGIDELDDLMDYKKLKGLPLKRIVEIYSNGEFGGRSLVEITEVVQSSVPESVFQIPVGYQKVEVPGQAPPSSEPGAQH